MIGILLEGLVFGLGLAVSLGPIFVALTQTSIEKGIKPGLTVGSGIWVSDILFIVIFYRFINELSIRIESEAFQFWLGISGALVLFGFGLYLIFSKPKLDYDQVEFSYKNYFGFWLKGFLINTINPFTVVFWAGVISSYVIGREISSEEAWVLLTTILVVIVLSDTGKVFLAHFLKQKLTPHHIKKVVVFSGFMLLCFGIFMAYQVI